MKTFREIEADLVTFMSKVGGRQSSDHISVFVTKRGVAVRLGGIFEIWPARAGTNRLGGPLIDWFLRRNFSAEEIVAYKERRLLVI